MTPNDGPQNRTKFLGLEVARGVAASLVALHHAGNMMVWSGISPIKPFGGVTGEFHVGVDFFFVLSGFLIAWIHWPDLGLPARLGRYLKRRFTRIYPGYWAVVIPLVVIDLVASTGGTHHKNIEQIVTSLLLLPSAQVPVLGVAWTLVFEIFFYAIFALLIRFGTRALILLPAWAALVLIHFALAGDGAFPASFFFSPYDLEFLLGIGIARILRCYRVPWARTVMVVGTTIFIAALLAQVGALLDDNSLEMRLIYGLSAGLIILGMVEAERSGALSFPIWLQGFGAASYAIYLVHPLAETGAMKLVRPHLAGISAELLTIIFASIGIAAGIAFHFIVEKPVTRWVRGVPFFRENVGGRQSSAKEISVTDPKSAVS